MVSLVGTHFLVTGLSQQEKEGESTESKVGKRRHCRPESCDPSNSLSKGGSFHLFHSSRTKTFGHVSSQGGWGPRPESHAQQNEEKQEATFLLHLHDFIAPLLPEVVGPLNLNQSNNSFIFVFFCSSKSTHSLDYLGLKSSQFFIIWYGDAFVGPPTSVYDGINFYV
ncbi:Uncharacterized protein TCM_006972 [Theobroma cacao]|uniref:Uncharacterized protein n=1 Tax=Theobroma cacao TaxID=3641 RepID=A0A061DZF5_THECC|nr:Uncharacterized protein TCM_006972 [Theobroma cacao]